MFLVIDCGNTNTVFAVYSFKNNELFLENSWRLDTSEKRTPDDYWNW